MVDTWGDTHITYYMVIIICSSCLWLYNTYKFFKYHLIHYNIYTLGTLFFGQLWFPCSLEHTRHGTITLSSEGYLFQENMPWFRYHKKKSMHKMLFSFIESWLAGHLEFTYQYMSMKFYSQNYEHIMHISLSQFTCKERAIMMGFTTQH